MASFIESNKNASTVLKDVRKAAAAYNNVKTSQKKIYGDSKESELTKSFPPKSE